MVKKIKKIMYVHYQLFEKDGSNTHTSSFIRCFSNICQQANIDFKVQAPKLNADLPTSDTSLLTKIRSFLARYYLRDFRVLRLNKKRLQQEITLLKKEQPDIVLTRFERETLSIIWACHELNIPVVIEINSPDIEAVNAHYLSLPYFKNLFSTKNAFKTAVGGFTVSENLSESVRTVIAKDKILTTIPNGVDTNIFNPQINAENIRQQLNIPKNTITLGFVGSFAPWHGIDLIAQALPILLKQGHQVHLILVGQSQGNANTLISNLLTSKYKENISVTGFIPLVNIPNYLAAMDITLLANTEDYCSPLKIFEYMAMGKAIISVNTDAVTNIMYPNKEGLVFARNNLEDFTKQLTKVICDEKLRLNLGIAARNRVVQDFQWQHNAQSIFNLIQRCYHK